MHRSLQAIVRGAATAALASAGLRAQAPVITAPGRSAPTVIVGPGWEAFPKVAYVGGDATQAKKRDGMLVLTDSTIALYECTWADCIADAKRSMIKGEPWWTIPVSWVREVTSSSQTRGPSTGSQLMWGALAGDHSDEFVGIVYESQTSAEAPIFKTDKAQAVAIEAKVKFRLKKLGVVLASP